MKKGFVIFLVSLFTLHLSLAQEKIFKWGIIERIRQETFRNYLDLENHSGTNTNQFRIRTNLWGKLDFREDMSIYAKITNESKFYIDPQRSDGIDEFVFDNFYFDWNKIFNSPLSLRIGRQNIIYGEGFLFIDGTPEDGSRTLYYNAIKATLKFEKWQLDILGIKDPLKDKYLPQFNDKHRTIVNQSEEGWGLYSQYDPCENWHLENYYFYKLEKSTPRTKLNTLGSRVVYKNSPWQVRSELAYQFGDYGENDRKGLGGYLFLDRIFKDVKFTPTLTVGGVYLSGDDPTTSRNESWDSLFSRWPYLSELYCYILAMEQDIAYWANMQIYKIGLNLKPSKKASIDLVYQYLRANENTFSPDYSSKTAFSRDGKERGHNFQILLRYKFNKNLDGHILFEYFHPQDYYVNTADDAIFFRWQLMYRF